MEKLTDLRALLKHEIKDVYSAEEQIIEALPRMIEEANNAKLKKALQNHLKITRNQKARLDKVQQLLKVESDEKGKGKKGFLGLFGGGGEKCKGMQGLIEESEKILDADIDPDVKDAAIIASAQKIEHYEICAYGTMKAFAQELKLTQVVKLLNETLDEEYESDDLLTDLAVTGGLNEKAEGPESRGNGRTESRTTRTATATGRASSPSRSTATSRTASGSRGNGNGRKSKTSSKKSTSSTSRKKASVKK